MRNALTYNFTAILNLVQGLHNVSRVMYMKKIGGRNNYYNCAYDSTGSNTWQMYPEIPPFVKIK